MFGLVKGQKQETESTLKPVQQSLFSLVEEGRMVIHRPLAERIIEEAKFDRQRKIERHHVELLANSMCERRFTHGTQLHFARLGSRLWLINGNHRLHAVALSGEPIEFQVLITDVKNENEVIPLYYRHDGEARPRSVADAIVAAGLLEKHHLLKGTAEGVYRATLLIEHKFAPPRYQNDPIAVQSRDARFESARQWWPLGKTFEDITVGAGTGLRRKLMSSGVFAVALITLKYQPDKSIRFWQGLSDDDGLRRDDPRKTLSRDLLENRRKPEPVMMAKIAAAAWNAFYQDRRLNLIRAFENSPVIILGTPFKGK